MIRIAILDDYQDVVEGTCNAQASDDRNWLEIQVLERRLQAVRPEGARFALHVLFAGLAVESEQTPPRRGTLNRRISCDSPLKDCLAGFARLHAAELSFII
jgi:hypothetical protein